MFERLSRSWRLDKVSGTVLMQDKELLVFPMVSGIATAIVFACFALPMFGMGALYRFAGASNETQGFESSALRQAFLPAK